MKGFNFEQWQAEYAARREKLKSEYCAEYGLKSLTDSEFCDLERARRQLQECDGCGKVYCNKVYEKFRRPLITTQDGRLKIKTVLCDVWLKEVFGEECQRAGIPLKYAARTFDDYEITAANARAVKTAQWFLAGDPKKVSTFTANAAREKLFWQV